MTICVVLTPTMPQTQINGKTLNTRNICIFFSILIYTFFWGVRYKVGADYEPYMDIYKYYDAKVYLTIIEPAFLYLCAILSKMGFSYVGLFVVTSFLNIYLLYHAFQSESSHYQRLAIYFYFTSGVVLFAQNGLRQMLVLNILIVTIFALKSAKKSINIITVILGCLISFFFHKSAIIPFSFLLLLFFLPKISFNRAYLIIPYLILYFTSSKLQFNVESFLPFVEDLGYARQLENINKELYENSSMTSSFSFGKLLSTLLIIIVFWYHKKFTADKTPIYYSFVFLVLGSFMSLVFTGLYLNRILLYFTYLKFIVLAYLCYELYTSYRVQKSSININLYLFMTSVYFVLYCYSIWTNSNKCVPYSICF